MNIILTGPRAVGKTRKGIILAERLNYKFIDCDELLEKRYKTTIDKIIKEKGWKEFRKMENENIKYLTKHYSKNVVLAIGGGAIASEYEDLREDNVKILKKYGKIILLLPTKDIEKNVEIIIKRIKNDIKTKNQRPRLTNLNMKDEILKTLKDRERFYKMYSDKIVYTLENKEEEIIEEMARFVKSF